MRSPYVRTLSVPMALVCGGLNSGPRVCTWSTLPTEHLLAAHGLELLTLFPESPLESPFTERPVSSCLNLLFVMVWIFLK